MRTVDGKLIALNLTDGNQAWFAQQTMPRLSVRGTGSPVVDGNLVICGFDNGRVAAYDINDGSVVWDVLVAPPAGRTEVERLSDINATVQVIGDDVYAVGYQGRLAALARESGQILWSVEFSSYSGLGADLNNLYVSGDCRRAAGRGAQLRPRVVAAEPSSATAISPRRRRSGLRRGGRFRGLPAFLRAPAPDTLQARVRPDSARITSAPLVVNDMLYVLTDGGELAAFRDATPREK